MGIASKYNAQVNRFTFQSDSTFDFFKLHDLFMENRDEVWIIKALWVNEESKFGPSPIVTLEDRYINLPGHKLQMVRDLIADDEAVEAINNGKLGFKVYQYNDEKHDKTCFSLTLVDID